MLLIANSRSAIRTLLTTSTLVLLAPLSAAQRASQATPLTAAAAATPIPGTLRDAGTYHVATGTWTRRPGQTSAAFGPDLIYTNTAQSGYFTSAGGAGGFAPGSINLDEGLIPVRGDARYPLADRAAYTVNCLNIGYCDLGAAGTAGWELSFYENYAPCSSPPTPTATRTITSLPATGCWNITIDLSGGQEFQFQGGDPGTGVTGAIGTFGWSYRYAGSDGTQPAGFLLAGDPANTEPGWTVGSTPMSGAGTYYGPPTACPGSGTTGNFTQDQWFISGPMGGCFFMGGYSNNNPSCGSGPFNPYASFSMEILAAPGPGNDPVGFNYCMAAASSTGQPSTLTLTGSDSAAANNLLMNASLPPNSVGVFITSQTAAFVPNFMGSSGNLCLGGTIGFFTAPGQVNNSGPNGVLLLDTQLSSWDVAAIPEGAATYAAAVGVTSNFQLWFRDVAAGTPTSNFSDAVEVTWTP